MAAPVFGADQLQRLVLSLFGERQDARNEIGNRIATSLTYSGLYCRDQVPPMPPRCHQRNGMID